MTETQQVSNFQWIDIQISNSIDLSFNWFHKIENETANVDDNS